VQVPAALWAATLQAVALFTSDEGKAMGAASASVVAIVRGGLQTMSGTRLKVILALLLVGLLGTGAGLLTYRKLADQSSPRVADAWKEPASQPPAAPAPLDVNAVLAEAIESARQAPGGTNISMLASIAAELAEAGNREAAEKTLREAFELTERLPDQRSQVYLLPILAKAERKVTGEIAARKTFQRALQIARDLQPENNRVDATQLIARVQAQAGDIAGARDAAAGVTPDSYRAQVLQDIAVDEAKAGGIKEALENVEKIPSWLSKAKAWAEIAVLRFRAGDRSGAENTLQKAMQAVSQIEELYKPGALDQIAVAQAHLGRMADARKTLIEASAIAKRNNMGQQTTLLPLAIARAESGNRAEAEKILNEVLKASQSAAPLRVPWYDIARVHIALGDLRAASEIVKGASRDWRSDNAWRELCCQIAKAQAEGGDALGAHAWAIQVSDPVARAAILYSLAQGMTLREKTGAASDTRKKLMSVPKPGPPLSPGRPATLHDDQFQSLRQEFETAFGRSSREIVAANTQEERDRAYEGQRQLVHNIAERMLALAQKYADEPLALDALAWVVENDLHSQTAARAFDRLANSHAESQSVGRVCDIAAMGWPHNSAEEFLRAVLEKNKERALKGLACLRLAEFLRLRADALNNLHKQDGAQLSEQWEHDYGTALVKQLQEMDRKTVLMEAEVLLERVVKQFADAKTDDEDVLGEIAKRHLFEMRHLTVGNPALEIEGEDLDGKPLKLSEQRGKVVVLTFWFSTCNPCRVMVPQERALVERLKDKRFILLGINNDQERAKAKEVVQNDRMSWRSWWDRDSSGRGPIATRWDVSSWPTVYVLDHKGTIRYKNVFDKELDEAIDTLLREQEADIGK
jgi:peroxiredoxin/tetratricopeptide (TPR) repeat protein